MKIIMLNYEFPPIGGGGGRAHLNILNEYSKKKDIIVDVLTSKDSIGIEIERFSANIRIHKIGIHKKSLHYWRKTEVIEWLFKTYPYYKKLLTNEKYNLAHAFFGFPTGLLCYLKRKQLPYIISLRGSDVPGRNARLALDYKILGGLFKKIWKHAETVIACSEGLRQRALQFYSDIEIVSIPNGVDLVRFQPPQEQRCLGNEPLKLITVGRLSATKRIDLLIDALYLLKTYGHSVQLTIIGDGPLKDSLYSIVHKKRLSNHVIFTGRLESAEIAMLYQQSNLYITATEQEGMSNTMLEALASGLPVITTKCEGIEELLTEKNGVIADSSALSLAASVDAMLKRGDNDYKNMCIAARRQVQQFTWANVGNAYISNYHDIITNDHKDSKNEPLFHIE